ncbi:MAG: ribosome rescue protein RqcH, partial [Promethearchaeota archaeon]
LSRNIHISGLYSEEICYRGNVTKDLPGKKLTDGDYQNLYESFKRLRNQLLFGNLNAQIVYNQQGNQLFVLPFELEILKGYSKKNFPSFNQAVDEFYSKTDSEILKSPKDQGVNDQIKSQEKILLNQQIYLEELKEKKKKNYRIGDLIYANLNSLEKLYLVILDAKKKGYQWEAINNKLQAAKLENLNGTEFYEKVIPSTNQLKLKIDSYDVYIDLKKSIGQNANQIYSKGKKAEKKIQGTITAIEKTKEKINKLKLTKDSIEKEIDFLIKKPKKKWYEKFRWFISTDGFLIIGGRDASSNESIFKNHLDPKDLVFHTVFPGSPLVVIKNLDDKTIPINTIHEAADFVASYSRAWKENWGIVEVFYIQPNQISKSPPSGEFLPKGSFIISGKKNFIKNAKTELTIGLKMIESEENFHDNQKIYYPTIISGPESTIKKQTKITIDIVPSKSNGLTKGKLAKEVKSYFLKNCGEELRIWVKLLSTDEIILFLPSGFSRIKSDS